MVPASGRKGEAASHLRSSCGARHGAPRKTGTHSAGRKSRLASACGRSLQLAQRRMTKCYGCGRSLPLTRGGDELAAALAGDAAAGRSPGGLGPERTTVTGSPVRDRVFLCAPCRAPQLERKERSGTEAMSLLRCHHRFALARARFAVNRAVPPRDSRCARDPGAQRKTGSRTAGIAHLHSPGRWPTSPARRGRGERTQTFESGVAAFCRLM